ncbi:hypothetical protein BDN71DRAFT_1381386 [Pleurotus eryngii]|uniref:Ubiquitin-like domain-containing protein n=1 Tax=Pleurotus eryngii TaxID=5323 RepID=A0A9P6A6B9_PLEER|nr:hypothetical protein BDN71DRAFT_1381386 [Pleurotus eryngii]
MTRLGHQDIRRSFKDSEFPPADVQRLLLKGKALVDTKLVKEYNVKNGDTFTLMFKPGVEWDTTKPTQSPSSTPSIMLIDSSKTPPPTGARKHQRIPSVVLSPSPSSGSPTFEKTIDIPSTLDTSMSLPEPMSTYHTTVAKPEFWERLCSFLSAEFPDESDAVLAFEEFLRASKGTLTASEIAKIRDEVGVIGMAGT